MMRSTSSTVCKNGEHCHYFLRGICRFNHQSPGYNKRASGEVEEPKTENKTQKNRPRKTRNKHYGQKSINIIAAVYEDYNSTEKCQYGPDCHQKGGGCEFSHAPKCKNGGDCRFLKIGNCKYYHQEPIVNEKPGKIATKIFDMKDKNEATLKMNDNCEVSSSDDSKSDLDEEEDVGTDVIYNSTIRDFVGGISLSKSIKRMRRLYCKKNAIKEQIKLVGGTKVIYDVVRNFNHFAPPIFMKEQFALYEWRRKFFDNFFPWNIWYTDGADDTRNDTIPSLFTDPKRFEEVMGLAFTRLASPIYFESECEGVGFQISQNFGRWNVPDQYITESGDELELNFSQSAHILTSFFSNSPVSLLEISMKKVMSLGLNVNALPIELKKKTSRGLYCWDIVGAPPTPDCLNSRGKDIYKKLVEEYLSKGELSNEEYPYYSDDYSDEEYKHSDDNSDDGNETD